MKGYLALIQINLKLAAREKAVLFFNYVFPLIFYFVFGQVAGARGPAMTQVVAMVLVLGILGNGLFGAGIRAVAEREANILRRYKVAPITPAPILVASMVTGWILYMPSVFIVLGLAHFQYEMPWPERFGALLALTTLGAFAMRGIGLIVASVVNSVAESNVLIQLLYMPMLFLSGGTIPLQYMPSWAQTVSQFLPATHLFTGMQGIVLRRETMRDNWVAAVAMVLTVIVATTISIKLFRWEKGEKIKNRSKLWIVAVLFPFVIIGTYQAYSKENLAKTRMYERDMRRSRARLIRGARIFTGNGTMHEMGSVLIREGKIAAVYPNQMPDAKSLGADGIEASGKTLMPGLIDVHVHLSAPAGIPEKMEEATSRKGLERKLAAYLYSGVTAVKSAGDPLDAVLNVRARVESGERLGSELFISGPLFTAEGGHGTEYFKGIPKMAQASLLEQFVRTPQSAEEAKQQVDALKARRVNAIKAIVDGGVAGMLFNRLDPVVLKAIVSAAHSSGLPVSCHTGDAKDVEQASEAGADSIEHGSARDRIPDPLFAAMKAKGTAYDPALSVIEAFREFAGGRTELLDRSLVAQVTPQSFVQNTKKKMSSDELKAWREGIRRYPALLEVANDNLLRAWRSGVPLVTGTDAGNILVVHGPAIHRELQLWVQAGIPPAIALQAATSNAAKLLRADGRIGLIKPGYEASLLLVDGNPLQDISSTERISAVFLKGERIDRPGLFDQDK